MFICNIEINGYMHEVHTIPASEITEEIQIKYSIGGYNTYEGRLYIASDEKYQMNIRKVIIHELAHAYLRCSGHNVEAWDEESICTIFEAFADIIVQQAFEIECMITQSKEEFNPHIIEVNN